MSSSGEKLPQFPVPSEHDALLAVLGHNELVELEGVFEEEPLTPWRLAIKQERLAREGEIQAIRSYLPLVEGPPYDPEAGPTGYLEQVRRFNFTTITFNHGAYPLKNEKRQIRQFADQYVKDHYPELWRTTWNTARLGTEELSVFFERSLRGIVLLPRMLGLMDFESQKYKTVRAYMPDTRINDTNVKYKVRDQNVTREQIEGAKQAVMALRHTTPLPDFFQMQPDQQSAIVSALGAEWLELCRLTVRFDPDALRMQAIRMQGALAYHSVARLQEAIEQNASIKPGKICRLFLRKPQVFEANLEAARAKVEREKRLQALYEAQKAQLAKEQTPQAGFRPEGTIQKTEGPEDQIDILNQDHARISVTKVRTGTQFYYMPLDRGNALLAARIIAALQNNKGEEFVEGAKIASSIWAQMSTEERELFITRKKAIHGSSSAIKPAVLGVMRKMTNLLGITRETSGERFKLEAVPVITLHAESPRPSELRGFRPVFPPGTDRGRIKQTAGGPIPENALKTARLLLEHQLDSSEPLSSGQALAILDLITDEDVKRAIRQQIREMGLERSSANVLENLRDQVKQSLDEAFESAWRNRMVAGNHATGDYYGRIRLIGGELPIITNPAKSTTKRWHIGQPSS